MFAYMDAKFDKISYIRFIQGQPESSPLPPQTVSLYQGFQTWGKFPLGGISGLQGEW